MFLPSGRGLPLLQGGDLAVGVFFFLLDPALDPFDFFAPICQLAVELVSQPDRFILRRELCVSSLLFRFLDNRFSLFLGLTDS